MDIVLSGICKNYSEKRVLKDFSHRFPESRISCVLGPSGCGKTTLLRLICGLEQPDAGTIEGNNVKFGMVFQENRLFENLCAEKNLLLTARKGFFREDARKLLEELGIHDFQKPVGAFSGGMKRRVAVARALASDWETLLLDEALTGLDGDNRMRTLEVIKKMTAGKTVICVTHSAGDAAYLGGNILEFK